MPTLMEKCSESRADWLMLRQGKIGASSAYHAANIDEGSNPLKVWLALRGEGESSSEDVPGKGWRYYGQKFEPVLGEVFCEKFVYDNPGAELKIISGDFLQQHPRYDFAIATPDFLVSVNGELCNLQTKTRSPGRYHEYEDDCLPNEDRTQIIHEVGVLEELGIRKAFLAAFFYPAVGQSYREPLMEYREVYIEQDHCEEIFSREQKLFNLAKSGVVPDLKNMTSDQSRALFWTPKTEVMDMHGNDAFGEAVTLYTVWKSKEKAAIEQREKASAAIMSLVGEGRKAENEFAKVAVIRTEFDALDITKLKADNPALYESLLKQYPRVQRSIYPRVTEKK